MRSDTDVVRIAASPLAALVSQILRFGGVGTVVAAFNYLGYLALLAFGVDYLWACVLSWMPSVALSYVVNRTATFRVAAEPTAREAGKFALAALAQLATALLGLYFLVEYAGLAPVPASFVNLGLSSIVNFAILRAFVFATARGA